MKTLLNKIFGVSQRCTGEVDENGKVTVTKIISYDLVADPGFDYADMSQRWKYEEEKVRREMERQELLKTRREKIDKLNNL